MADEIKIPLRLSLNTQANANGSWAPINSGDPATTTWGWILLDADNTDYTFHTVVPIPATINSTPDGEIWVRWVTDSTSITSDFRFTFAVTDVGREGSTDDWSPTEFADTGVDIQSSSAQRGDNTATFSLSSTAQTADKMLIGTIGRDGPHVLDTATSSAWIIEAWYVADIA